MVDHDNAKLRASGIYHRDQQNRVTLEIAVIVSQISNVIGRFLKIIQNYWLIFIAMYVIHTPNHKNWVHYMYCYLLNLPSGHLDENISHNFYIFLVSLSVAISLLELTSFTLECWENSK